MEPGRELQTPPSADETPLPMSVNALTEGLPPARDPAAQPAAESAPNSPTAETILLAISAAGAEPWFPSRHSTAAQVPRDSLDEPLARLRLAGLVCVGDWVRGEGQAYVLTPEGESVAKDPATLARLRQPADSPTSEMESLPPQAVQPADADREAADAELDYRPPVVVPALLLANVLWFFVCAAYGIRWGLTLARSLSEGHPEVLKRFGAVTGADLLDGEWWRLITSCFVHIGALHLIGNMFALAMMGPLAELLWGRGRLLLIYFTSGLAGSALAMALRPDSLLAGASGAIWGILMSLFAWLLTYRKHLPPDVASDWFRRLSVVFVLSAGVSFLPGISWEGHLGGGVAGFLTALLLNVARFGDRPRRLSAWLLIALLPVLSVAMLASAMGAKGMTGWQKLRERLAAARETREKVSRHNRYREAEAEYRTKTLPRLAELAPHAVLVGLPPPRYDLAPEAALSLEAKALYALAGSNRAPERVAVAKSQVNSLKADAEAVIHLTEREPTGVESFDRHVGRAHAFAEARRKSYLLLLDLLTTGGTPAPGKWEAWKAARREADKLWPGLMPPS